MSSLIPPYDADEYEEADVTEDGMVLIAGVLYDAETGVEADAECQDSPTGDHEPRPDRWGDNVCIWCLEDPEDVAAEAKRQHLLEMLDEAGAEDEYDEIPVDLNPEGDPTRNGAF